MNLPTKPVPSTLAFKTIPINPRMVRAEDVKLCKNCKYFQPIEYYANKEDGYCKLFGKMNVVNGDIAYKFASEARDAPNLSESKLNSKGVLDSDDDFVPMCGIEALFYEETEPDLEPGIPEQETDIKTSS